MEDPPRRIRSPRQPRQRPVGPPGPPPALEEPVDIDRYQRRWRFVVTDLGPASGPRWMWEGPDGPIDARAFQPTSRRAEVIEALHFWVHDWAYFRGTRRLELGGTEWTARRASRGVLGGRAPGDVPGGDDPAGIHFRSAGAETLFLPLGISGPDFVTMPRVDLVELLHRALGR